MSELNINDRVSKEECEANFNQVMVKDVAAIQYNELYHLRCMPFLGGSDGDYTIPPPRRKDGDGYLLAVKSIADDYKSLIMVDGGIFINITPETILYYR